MAGSFLYNLPKFFELEVSPTFEDGNFNETFRLFNPENPRKSLISANLSLTGDRTTLLYLQI